MSINIPDHCRNIILTRNLNDECMYDESDPCRSLDYESDFIDQEAVLKVVIRGNNIYLVTRDNHDFHIVSETNLNIHSEANLTLSSVTELNINAPTIKIGGSGTSDIFINSDNSLNLSSLNEFNLNSLYIHIGKNMITKTIKIISESFEIGKELFTKSFNLISDKIKLKSNNTVKIESSNVYIPNLRFYSDSIYTFYLQDFPLELTPLTDSTILFPQYSVDLSYTLSNSFWDHCNVPQWKIHDSPI